MNFQQTQSFYKNQRFYFLSVKFQQRGVENAKFNYTISKVTKIVENYVENVKNYVKTVNLQSKLITI